VLSDLHLGINLFRMNATQQICVTNGTAVQECPSAVDIEAAAPSLILVARQAVAMFESLAAGVLTRWDCGVGLQGNGLQGKGYGCKPTAARILHAQQSKAAVVVVQDNH
jgi:hypothetical protein